MDEIPRTPSDAAVADIPPHRRGPAARPARRAADGRLRRRRRERPLALPVAAAALGAAAYAALDPPSADLAAQTFRADLFAREGFTLVNTAWYGGHHTPGYSVLFPPLAALLGVRMVGALAAVAATWAFGRLAGRTAALLFVPGILATLVSGRLTFALGTAFGVAAVWAAARGRPALAAAGGVLTALASPVAALYAGVAAAALVLAPPRPTRRRRARTDDLGDERQHANAQPQAATTVDESPRAGAAGRDRRHVVRAGVALGVGAAAPTLALVVAFPEGGTFPFVSSAFWPAFAFGLGVAVVAPLGPLRVGGLLYALLCVLAFTIPSPIGGNATRLGTLVALPLMAVLVWPRSRTAAVALALPLMYWVLQPPVRDVLRAHDDPSVHAAFHAPLVAFLDGRGPVRVEVPLTQNHGEATHLARHVAIARGWERQVDRAHHPLFYDGTLTAAGYRRWLDENAVSYVALPAGVPLDAAGEAEAELIRRGLPFLAEAARLPGWRVYAVRDARPIGVDRLTTDTFTVRRSGVVRVRWSPYWAVARGSGCVARAPGGWTRVTVTGPGAVEVRPRFALGRVRATSARCR